MNKVKEIIPYIIIIIVVFLIRIFIITPAIVDGDSMYNTLEDGEVIFENKISLKLKKISRFEIVVFKYEKEKLIKRVIGLPNEKIEYRSNKLYINGIEVELPLKFENTEDFIYETKEDEYFLMGDNRDISKDSRFFGGINKKNIEGTVKFVFFPFTKFGIIE